MVKYSMFMNKKTQYCQDVSSSQLDLQIQCNSNQNPRKLIHGYQQTDSKLYMERQKPRRANIEREEQRWRTDATQL